MKKFITILSALILVSIAITAQAQTHTNYVQSKTIDESCTIVKEITYLSIAARDLEGPVKETKTMKAKIEWKYYGMCTLSLILNDGEEIQIERWSGDNLRFERLKTEDGHYSYALSNKDFLFFALAWTPYTRFDDDTYINEGHTLIVKTSELD